MIHLRLLRSRGLHRGRHSIAPALAGAKGMPPSPRPHGTSQPDRDERRRSASTGLNRHHELTTPRSEHGGPQLPFSFVPYGVSRHGVFSPVRQFASPCCIPLRRASPRWPPRPWCFRALASAGSSSPSSYRGAHRGGSTVRGFTTGPGTMATSTPSGRASGTSPGAAPSRGDYRLSSHCRGPNVVVPVFVVRAGSSNVSLSGQEARDRARLPLRTRSSSSLSSSPWTLRGDSGTRDRGVAGRTLDSEWLSVRGSDWATAPPALASVSPRVDSMPSSSVRRRRAGRRPGRPWGHQSWRPAQVTVVVVTSSTS